MIEACYSVLLSAGWFGRVLGAALFWAVPLLAVFLVIQLGCFSCDSAGLFFFFCYNCLPWASDLFSCTPLSRHFGSSFYEYISAFTYQKKKVCF